VLGEFDPYAELDVVEQGIKAWLIAVARLGQDVQHSVEPDRIDPPHKQVPAQRLELIEQPLPAANFPAPAFERIANRLQGEQPFDARDTGGHGDGRGPGGGCRTADDEIRPGRTAGAAAPCHSRYSRIAVDPHQTHLGQPLIGKICRRGLSNG
jgi:hypothetical protein